MVEIVYSLHRDRTKPTHPQAWFRQTMTAKSMKWLGRVNEHFSERAKADLRTPLARILVNTP